VKKIIIVLLITVFVSTITYTQYTVEEFYIHDGENIFYLRIPANEIRRLLGSPIEEIKIIREHYHRPNYFIIKYHGIEFTYFDFSHRPEVSPTIIMITFKEPYKITNINVIGLNKKEVLEHFGEPTRSVEENDSIFLYYEFNLCMPHHLVLRFRFNIMGICDEVSLIHSNFYI